MLQFSSEEKKKNFPVNILTLFAPCDHYSFVEPREGQMYRLEILLVTS